MQVRKPASMTAARTAAVTSKARRAGVAAINRVNAGANSRGMIKSESMPIARSKSDTVTISERRPL